MSEVNLVSSWFQNFGDMSAHPRHVINYALTEPEFLRALTETIPELTQDHLLPTALAKWLSKNENRLIRVDDATTYRFSRHGHRWRCLPVKVMVAAE